MSEHVDRCHVCWTKLNPKGFWHSFGIFYCCRHCKFSPRAKALEKEAASKPPYKPDVGEAFDTAITAYEPTKTDSHGRPTMLYGIPIVYE